MTTGMGVREWELRIGREAMLYASDAFAALLVAPLARMCHPRTGA